MDSISYLGVVEKIQKRAARWICCHWSKQNYLWLPSYEEACTQLRWHSLATRRTILTCCQVFKIIHKQDSLNLNIYPQLGHMIFHCFVPHPTLDIPFLLIANIYVWITLPSTIAHAQTLYVISLLYHDFIKTCSLLLFICVNLFLRVVYSFVSVGER